ncbi:ABC-2 family transporter [Prauserella shujinwangii]|uniref:ABC-2 family transporter n=1 Tax=Prauserella shujinwangii TaxID=1453103 RepID=A0A2T0LKY0_9PSEU|nr:ABC transporter permease subunit [Prauserella shujinwangii]PRX43603.1 ABC-2 family transporter [Prauserella shujinwangii]
MTATIGPPRGGGLPGAVHSEWTKLWSVRSSWWTVLAAAVLMLGYTALAATAVPVMAEHGDPEAATVSAPGLAVNAVFFLAQFPVLALATLFIAGEYGTGAIRSTLQWVPVRGRVLTAKCAALLPALCGLGVVLTGAALALAVPLMGGAGVPLTAGEAVRTALAIGGYFVLLGAFALGVGTALRSVAGALTVSFVALLALPMLCSALGLTAVLDYLPGVAGVNLMLGEGTLNDLTGQPVPYARWVAALVLGCWSAAALGAGAAVLRSRDAG